MGRSKEEDAPRYSFEGEIARGGMAAINRVVDHRLQRVSAMKVLDEDFAALANERQRFLEEAQITGQLDHPNIVPVYDIGIDADGQPYFTMKLVEGETLSAELKRARASHAPGSLDWLERLLEIFLKVCDAVAFAHSRGVVHRDLKPSNILVGNYGEVYVMDWGLARVLDREGGLVQGVAVSRDTRRVELDPEGTAIGTAQFMSPEQALGNSHLVDERTDVFALGALLYYILTGQPPFPFKDIERAILAAQEARVTPPEDVVPELGLSPKICQVAMKAMARDPAARFQSVANLRRAVHRFLRGGMHLPTRTFAAGSLIIQAGEKGDAAYIITQGTCQAFKMVDGGKLILRLMGPGEVFGETAILAAKPRTASVEAIEEMTVMVVTAEVLAEGLGMNSWMGAFVKALAERFREADERLTELESMMLQADDGGGGAGAGAGGEGGEGA